MAEVESDGTLQQDRANTVLIDFNANSNSNSSSEPSSKSHSDSGSRFSGTTPPSPVLSSLDDKNPSASTTEPPLHLLFLGSSLGNFSRKEMIGFLSRLPLRAGSGDTLLLGLDGDNGKELVEKAYNDSKGITKDFIMNGLKGMNAPSYTSPMTLS